MVVRRKGEYFILSKERKVLSGPYETRGEALKRLRQIEMFKHMKKREK